MRKYTFADDGPAQHLAGVVVETSEEIADRIPGLKSGGRRSRSSGDDDDEPKKAAPQKTTTRTAPKPGS